MPWIQNYSIADVMRGRHCRTIGGVLICITEPGSIVPNFSKIEDFKFIYHLSFPDISYYHPSGITYYQAEDIATTLEAGRFSQNIVVCCPDGMSRSGAIVECAKFLGYNTLVDRRIPNARVKKAIMYALGLGYEGVE